MKKTYVTTVGTFLLGLTLNSCIQESCLWTVWQAIPLRLDCLTAMS